MLMYVTFLYIWLPFPFFYFVCLFVPTRFVSFPVSCHCHSDTNMHFARPSLEHADRWVKSDRLLERRKEMRLVAIITHLHFVTSSSQQFDLFFNLFRSCLTLFKNTHLCLNTNIFIFLTVTIFVCIIESNLSFYRYVYYFLAITIIHICKIVRKI